MKHTDADDLWFLPASTPDDDGLLLPADDDLTARSRASLAGDLDDVLVDPPSAPMPNARRFLANRYDHARRPLLVCHGGVFFAYTGTCWTEVEADALRGAIYRAFEDAIYKNADGETVPFRPDRRKVGDLQDALRAACHLSRDVTAPAWLGEAGPVPADELVVCANGLLHVPTRTLHGHTPDLYVHHAVPFAYDDAAPTPARWLRFLEELWPDDPESITALQQWFGYLLAGDTSLQKMLMLVGPRRSGKGTIARVLTGLLGPHHVAGPTLASLSSNFGLSPMIGKPVAIVSDARIAAGQSIVVERLLSISGEDTLTVDRKYREPWTGRFPTRFVILTNELPRLSDSSGALASRFVTLVTTNSFYGREDPRLTDTLLEELPGILNWSLDGLDALRAAGRFTEPSSSADAVQELEDLASPVGAFVRDRCIVGPEHTVACDALYGAWKDWCADNGRDRPGTAQTFGRDIRAAVLGLKVTQPRGEDGRQHRHYSGIGLCDHTAGCPHAHSGETRVSSRVTVLKRDDTRTGPLLAEHCQGCQGEADRQSARGTWWCTGCWNAEAGGAA
jgi:putative DNA primase/helicase